MRLAATISLLLALVACGGGSPAVQQQVARAAPVPNPPPTASAHCRAADGTMKRVWNQRIRDGIRTSFASTNRGYAEDTFARVRKALDDHADEITRARGALCELEEQEPGAETRDAHFCLDRRLSQLEAISEVFTNSVSELVVDNAVRATLELGDIESCADPGIATAPEDDAQRRELLDAWAADDEVRARIWVESYDEANQLLVPLVDRDADAAVVLDRAVLRASLAGRVTALASGRKVVDEAIELAKSAGDVTALDTLMIYRVALVRGNEARTLGEELYVSLLARGETRALGRLCEVLGDIEVAERKWGDALTYFRHAISANTDALGADHPAVADVLAKAGEALGRADKPGAASEQLTRAADVYVTTLGPDHVTTAYTHYRLGWLLEEDKQLARAIAAYDLALAARQRTYPPGDDALTNVQRRLVETLTADGKLEEAERRARVMVEQADAVLPPDSLGLATVYKMLGRVLWHRESWDESELYFGRALDIRRHGLPQDHVDIAWSVHDIGDVLHGRGQYDEAVRHYEDAYRMFEGYNSASYKTQYIAHIRWDLARCLWDQNQDRERARQLATQARDAYASINPERSLEIDAWLQANRP